MSGLMVNHNDFWEFHRPYPRTSVNVLGMNINRNPPPLPDNLRKFVEGADQGVVVFALGVSLIPADLPEQHLNWILEAFSRLPQRVIMRLHAGRKGINNIIL